uniref:Uncharacterized protein n=1 Tax=Anguilla anguilla TaxID=7936 RepID=A0A0E9XA41_ANGAN
MQALTGHCHNRQRGCLSKCPQCAGRGTILYNCLLCQFYYFTYVIHVKCVPMHSCLNHTAINSLQIY